MYRLLLLSFSTLWITGAQQLPPGFDPVTLLKFREMQMRDACPEGVISCECNDAPGKNVTDHFFLEDGLVNAMITHAGCNPGLCTCKGKPPYEVDITPPPLKAILRVCPKGKMNRCLCKDDTKIEYPWTMMTIMPCKPRKCKCNGSNEVKIVDGMGCKEGGSPDCPNQFELYCKDGTYLGPNELMEWKLRRGTGCPCPDGIMGICKSTGKTMKCPNGEEPDWFNTRGTLEKEVERELKDCRLE